MASGGNRLAWKPLPIPATAIYGVCSGRKEAASRIRLRRIAGNICQGIFVSCSLRLRVLLQHAYLTGVVGSVFGGCLRRRRAALRYVWRRACPGRVLGCLALVVGSDVLGYGAFSPIAVLRNRTARL